MKRLLLLILIATLSSNCVFAQYSFEYLKKYWFYRNRFLGNGTVENPGFIKVGLNIGESIPMSLRNPEMNCQHGSIFPLPCGEVTSTDNGKLHWGDATINLGRYLGVLATEWKLLNNNSQSTFNTEIELANALIAFDRLDENAEPYLHPGEGLDANGFFLRDDVPSTFHEHFPGYNCVKSDASCYSCECTMAECEPFDDLTCTGCNDHINERNKVSQDQIISILMGCALINKCVPDWVQQSGISIRAKAREIVDRLGTMMWNDGGKDAWFIKDPVTGTQLSNAEGGDARIFSRGFFKSIKEITGSSFHTAFNWLSIWELMEDDFESIIRFNNGTSTSIQDFIDAFNNITGATVDPPTGHEFNTHMWLTLVALSDTWPRKKVGEAADLAEMEIFALVYELLHGKNTDLSPSVYESIMGTAPCEGPVFLPTNQGVSGWRSTYRFACPITCSLTGDPGFDGEYSGLDYMLFHNLYFLVRLADDGKDSDGNTLPGFLNLMDFREVFDFPVTLPLPFNNFITFGSQTSGIEANRQMFNSITSDKTINEDGLVTYRAGSEISLEDGFEVKAGAEFFAFVDPFECVGGSYQKTGDSTASLYGMTDPLPMENNNIMLEYEEEDNQTLYDIPDTSSTKTPQPGFNIYPNPYQTDKLFVDITGNDGARVLVVVVDMLGIERYSKVFVLKEDNYTLAIDPEGKLPAGVYMVIAASDDEIYRKKIVIQ